MHIMKWFKHMSNSRRDIFIQELFEEFGHSGPCSWWWLLEIMAEDSGQKMTASIEINKKILAKELRLSQAKAEKFLRCCEGFAKVLLEDSKNKWKITIPKFLELKDNYTKDLQATSKKLAPQEKRREEKRKDKETKAKKVSYGTIDIQIVDFFVDGLRRNDPKIKIPSNLDKWRDSSRLMREQDNRTESEIRSVIEWTLESEFWKPNILSIPKLREKFDQLIAQSKRKPDKIHKVDDLKSETEQAYNLVKEANRIKSLKQIGVSNDN